MWYCRFYQGRRSADDARQISHPGSAPPSPPLFILRFPPPPQDRHSQVGMVGVPIGLSLSPVFSNCLSPWTVFLLGGPPAGLVGPRAVGANADLFSCAFRLVARRPRPPTVTNVTRPMSRGGGWTGLPPCGLAHAKRWLPSPKCPRALPRIKNPPHKCAVP